MDFRASLNRNEFSRIKLLGLVFFIFYFLKDCTSEQNTKRSCSMVLATFGEIINFSKEKKNQKY